MVTSNSGFEWKHHKQILGCTSHILSERAFSIAGSILTSWRNCLFLDNVRVSVWKKCIRMISYILKYKYWILKCFRWSAVTAIFNGDVIKKYLAVPVACHQKVFFPLLQTEKLPSVRLIWYILKYNSKERQDKLPAHEIINKNITRCNTAYNFSSLIAP